MHYQFYQNTLTVPARMLYEDLGIMTESNYKFLCRTGKLNRVRTARGLDNTALVDFDNIPERFKVQVVQKLGIPPKKSTQNLILNYYKDDYEAQDYYANYTLDDYRTLPAETQNDYTINAQMLQAIDAYIREMVTFRKSRGGKAALTKIWEETAIAADDVKAQTGHTLPKSVRRLKEKLEEFKKEGYSALISENFGNKKAARVKDMTQEATLRQLLRDHRNLDNEQIGKIYNTVAKIQNWAELSAGTIGNYRTKWNLLTIAGTKGEKAFDNKIAMQVKRAAPSSPLLYWTVDGWDAELLYQKSTVNAKGASVTTYHNRLTIVVVLDPCCKYPVGYAIGTQENATLIKAALRNAVQHTEELFGQKHKVLQIQSDNYAKKEMTSFYEIVSDKFTPAKVGNAKSKVIEPWFRHFNKNYCQYALNWSGQGVKSKTQPNDEYLNKIRHSFPDQDGCIIQLTRMIENERERLKDQYLAAYAEMPEDAKKAITQQEYLQHFGQTTGFTNKVAHNGLNVTIEGQKIEYDSFDINFRLYSHLDWTIKYDSSNLNEVLAFNPEQNISFLLNQKYVQPMALYDRRDDDGEELAKVGQFNKAAKAMVVESVIEDTEIVNQMFVRNPELQDTLAKMLLVDSKGQHKDQRNASRLKTTAQKVLEKQDKKEQKAQESDWETEQMEYLSQKTDYSKYLDNEY